jgi:lysophospholipase L1-like esterase
VTGSGGKGSGGSSSSGGAVGSGGSASGGVTGSGGKGSGGSSSSGGTVGSGGAAAGGSASGGAGGAIGGGAGGHVAAGGATGSGGSSGGGGAGSGSFSPCPTTGACKILPFGDSITYGLITATKDQASSDASVNGKDSHGGYRVKLFTDAVNAGKNITFVGSQMNGPTMAAGMTFPKSHEGWSGYTILQVQPYVAMDTKYAPNIILLHIGTNDTYMSDPGGAPMRLQTMVDMILSMYPDTLLVLAQIIPYPSQAPNVKAINDSIPALVQSRAAMGKHIIMADLFTGFMPATMQAGDGVHPNQMGYDWMGDTWYAAISSYLH